MERRDRNISTADLARDAGGASPDRADDRTADPRRQASAPPVGVPGGAPTSAAMDDRTPPPPRGAHPAGDRPAALFPDGDAERLRSRWTEIQADFVDAPRQAVERADSLVAEAMKRLAEVFASERAGLEGQWDRGDRVTTEDLRVALQRYRAFFDRLLSV